MNYITFNVKIVTILTIILLVILFTGKSYSQNKSDSFLVQLKAVCMTEKDLERILDVEFEEIPMLTMTSRREIEGLWISIPTVMFANPKTQSWTMVEQWGKNQYCITGVGINVSPYIESNKNLM
jgi:hypothetical protein